MSRFKLSRNLGMSCLGVWLIASGLIPLLKFSFEGLPMVMAVFAVLTGVLILLGR